jgi:hypothetical protein
MRVWERKLKEISRITSNILVAVFLEDDVNCKCALEDCVETYLGTSSYSNSDERLSKKSQSTVNIVRSSRAISDRGGERRSNLVA